jgi:two-component system cell cycle sensor histidine kinase PleC
MLASANADTKPQILVVDDEPEILNAMADCLKQHYEVICKTSAAEALAVLKENRRVQVILSDQRMPGMTGDEFLTQARKYSDATRILVSAYADLEALIKAVNGGKIYSFLQKPWHADELKSMVSDAVERFGLREALNREKVILECIMNCSTDAISVKDIQHRYVRLNDAEADMLGETSASDVTGRSHDEFLDTARSAVWDKEEKQVMDSLELLKGRVEHLVDNHGLERWYYSRKTPIQDSHGQVLGLVSVTQNITEAKSIEQIKDNFIASVSHELKTPLTVINGVLRLVSSGNFGELSPRLRSMLDKAEENCRKMISLVNNILDLQNLLIDNISVDLRAIAVHEIVEESLKLTLPFRDINEIEIIVEGEIPDTIINGNKYGLVQALANLLSNACRFSEPKAKVHLVIKELEDNVRFTVLDTGIGVPTNFAAKLFEPFTQADNSGSRLLGGAGLGLRIAKLIMDGHDGKIGYRPRTNGGSEFFLELPRQAADREAVGC